MKPLNSIFLTLVAALSLVVMPCAANASDLACNGAGGVSGGQLYAANVSSDTGACQFHGVQHVASQVICNFVMILNSVLGKVYCGIQFSMTTILSAVLTVYIVLFGAQLLMGMAQLNAKEVITRILKIGGVWAFATQSAWGIGVAFDFFLSFVNSGSSWVIGSINTANPAGFPVTGADNPMPLYGYIDSLIYSAITGPFTSANEKVIGFFLAMAVVFWPLLMIGVKWLMDTFMLLAETILSFMLALSAVAFLITLSPIFLSFMLFKATAHFFESWLRYIVSYAFQVVLIFAVIAIWISVMGLFGQFFNQLSTLIFPYRPIVVEGPGIVPVNSWAICPAIYGNDVFGPTATCIQPFDPFDPVTNQGGSLTDRDQLIPSSAIVQQGGFLYFIVYHMITLTIIAYAFTRLLQNAPKIAQSLTGSGHAPVLSGGWGNSYFGKTIGHQMPQMIAPGGASNDFVQRMLQMFTNRSTP